MGQKLPMIQSSITTSNVVDPVQVEDVNYIVVYLHERMLPDLAEGPVMEQVRFLLNLH